MPVQSDHPKPFCGDVINRNPVRGTVRSWDDELGWGVLTSPEVPGEVWAHFSTVRTDPGVFASLEPGEDVLFTWEEAEQDGFSYRTVQVQRPGGTEADWDWDSDENDDGDGDDEAELESLSDLRIELDP